MHRDPKNLGVEGFSTRDAEGRETTVSLAEIDGESWPEDLSLRRSLNLPPDTRSLELDGVDPQRLELHLDGQRLLSASPALARFHLPVPPASPARLELRFRGRAMPVRALWAVF